jgi:hypothetical protein
MMLRLEGGLVVGTGGEWLGSMYQKFDHLSLFNLLELEYRNQSSGCARIRSPSKP